ncbi:MFS transporter [Smaragdicoccus niigatensis]|uniref:MFS transporter n=1 Tax=Smaragdicoccus niigatensis TaxID=359359 RepID=UPI00039A4F19|nr:MFS transporter [Smaragdicoccus niigatensis]
MTVQAQTRTQSPWVSLATLCLGFFMILLDMTIVAVANPAILAHFDTGINNVIWVTSAYLLTYAVPLLITGRLGDRFGPKNIYLFGLAIFTAASLWCGLANTIEMLIAARAVQGLGAALMSPQTMSVIARIFPPDKRGAAMGIWGAVAGIATLVGPIAGGLLVDGLGWQWIFFINVPIGILAIALGLQFIPKLPTHSHSFDIPGVVVSAIGMFLLVFGLQEGETDAWAPRIWMMIAGGILILIVFVVMQARTKREPLVPLELFKVRNFAMSTLAICVMGAAITAMTVPTFFYLQAVHGLSPTASAFTFAPMAITTGLLAPAVGKLVDRMPPRVIPTIGFASFAVGIAWFALIMKPDTSIWMLALPLVLMGSANAFIWAPLAATAMHDLPFRHMGAGSGVYNTARQSGSVLGSAAISALITARMTAHGLSGSQHVGSAIPGAIKDSFSSALGEAMLLPAGILIIGLVASFVLTQHRDTHQPKHAR